MKCTSTFFLGSLSMVEMRIACRKGPFARHYQIVIVVPSNICNRAGRQHHAVVLERPVMVACRVFGGLCE